MEPDELKRWREDLGFTQEELAKELQVASNTVSRWERGDREIPPYLELALKQLKRQGRKK